MEGSEGNEGWRGEGEALLRTSAEEAANETSLTNRLVKGRAASGKTRCCFGDQRRKKWPGISRWPEILV